MDGPEFGPWARTTPFCLLQTSRTPTEPKSPLIKIGSGVLYRR